MVWDDIDEIPKPPTAHSVELVETNEVGDGCVEAGDVRHTMRDMWARRYVEASGTFPKHTGLSEALREYDLATIMHVLLQEHGQVQIGEALNIGIARGQEEVGENEEIFGGLVGKQLKLFEQQVIELVVVKRLVLLTPWRQHPRQLRNELVEIIAKEFRNLSKKDVIRARFAACSRTRNSRCWVVAKRAARQLHVKGTYDPDLRLQAGNVGLHGWELVLKKAIDLFEEHGGVFPLTQAECATQVRLAKYKNVCEGTNLVNREGRTS